MKSRGNPGYRQGTDLRGTAPVLDPTEVGLWVFGAPQYSGLVESPAVFPGI